MKFGLELELVGADPINFYRNNQSLYQPMDKYTIGELTFRLGTDGSISKWPSMELRVDPLTDISHIPPLVKLLKSQQICGSARHKCGMHIHVDFNRYLRLKYQHCIIDYFNEKWARTMLIKYRPHPNRMSYCGNGLARSSRYSAVNTVSEFPTLEFRLFNAVLNSRYICRAISDALDITKDIEQHVKEIEARDSSRYA